MAEETEAYQVLLQMFEVIERTTYQPPRTCFNQLVRYLADCVRIRPLPKDEHHIGERLLPLTKRFLEAFYEEPQDHLGTIFSEKDCANKNLGQLITPRYIVQYINQATIGELAEEEEKAQEESWKLVLDPCTGTGRFLVEAAVQFPKRKLAFFGVELDIDLYRAALVNMRLTAWNRPHYILCADALIADLRLPSPNWRYANLWEPPDWREAMVMENGQTWVEWCEEHGYDAGGSLASRREPKARDHQDPLQPRLF